MTVTEQVLEFKKKYPWTIAWRLKKNASVIEKHLNPGEKVLYAFAGQRKLSRYDIFHTAVVAITNKRIIVGRKRVIFGYFFDAVTPDMFNHFKMKVGFFFGRVIIDTIKEKMMISCVSKKAMPEIETALSENIMLLKRDYEGE